MSMSVDVKSERSFRAAWVKVHHVLSAPLLAASTALLLGCTGGYMDAGSEAESADADLEVDAALASDELPSTSEVDAAAPARSPSAPTHDLFSNEAVVSLLRERAYRGPGYRQVNPRPFPSTVSPDKTIALWISEQGYEQYTTIAPDRVGSNAHVPVGTVIVREVLSQGVLDTITVMMRLPTGAFPLGGDWWYCSADPDGTIRTTSDGAPIIGLLEDCGSCHLRRSNDDYLFGAPGASLR